MKMVFKLFAYEFKNIYKQALIFAFISTFLFALSISVMCFSSDMVQGYRDYLDEDGYYTSLSIYGVNVLDKYNEVDSLCGYFSAHAYGICENIEKVDGDKHGALITYRPMLQKDGLTSGYHGRAFIFRDELPREIDEDCFLEEGNFGSAYNDRNTDGKYSVFISAKVGEELQASVGDTVTLNYELIDGVHAEDFTVAGIYRLKDDTNSSYHIQFIIPFNFVNENITCLTTNEFDFYDGYSYFLQLNKPSDIMDLLPKLRRLNLGKIGLFNDGEEIDLVNTMRFILIAVAVAIVIVTFIVLSNSLTITVNSRKKFMAKLKLLGATTDKITSAYFLLLIVSFIAAFALSILLSYFMCGYFTSIAVAALEYKVVMQLHWGAVGILFAVGCALLAVRYVLFRIKVKKVAPAEFIKEE